MDQIKLTQYSHGAGCGCKIAPQILDQILKGTMTMPDNKNLLVGNNSKDDAAIYDLGNGDALISTTDFFMPIVDDPYEFGRIASANAISDVYAMGGKPILAIAILGWPINKLSPEIASKVLEGSKSICLEAGIPLAGGHSIDSPEPIFGLAVNGLVKKENVKQNNQAKEGDIIYLTKKIGVGILTTAEKKGILELEDQKLASEQMMKLNLVGEQLGKIKGVSAMTDVTGFGLLGHLNEMTEGSGVSAIIYENEIKLLGKNLDKYIESNAIPGGTIRNWKSYGENINIDEDLNLVDCKIKFADPQTSGGLLVAANPMIVDQIEKIFEDYGLQEFVRPIGKITKKENYSIYVTKFQ